MSNLAETPPGANTRNGAFVAESQAVGLMARPDATQLEALLDEADAALGRLRRDGPEVLRRARAGVAGGDGYPSRSGPVAGAGSHGDSGPERIGLGHWSRERQDAGMEAEVADPYARGMVDPVRRAANGMVSCLRDALRELRKADGDRDIVVGKAAHDVTPLGSRPTTIGLCWVCEAPAHPVVAGMCTVCLAAWDAAGRPDRAGFRVARRQALAGGRLFEAIGRRLIPDDALRLPGPASMAAVCALCGHDPACARVPAWDDQRPVLVCDHCYEGWVRGERR